MITPKHLRNVIFINQVTYHIDLMLFYIGAGVFLLASFTCVVEFLAYLEREIVESRLNFSEDAWENKVYLNIIRRLRDNSRRLAELYEPTVQHIARQINAAGLKCILIPGFIVPGELNHGGSLDSSPRPTNPISMTHLIDNLAFNFMNGLAIAPWIDYSTPPYTRLHFQILVSGPRRQNLFFDNMRNYITRKIVDDLATYFQLQKECLLVNIEAIYGTDSAGKSGAESVLATEAADSSIRSTPRMSIEDRGSLRCQTALLSLPIATQAIPLFKTPSIHSLTGDDDFDDVEIDHLLPPWGSPDLTRPPVDGRYKYLFCGSTFTYNEITRSGDFSVIPPEDLRVINGSTDD